MKERRRHKRLPVLKDLAEPIELTISDSNASRNILGILTNLSAGGMDMVLLSALEGRPNVKMSLRLPGFTRFEVEGRMVWTKPREGTTAVGIAFTNISDEIAKRITHMAEAYWECEERIRAKAPMVCFHGCTYWDLCEKPAKLRHLPKTAMA